MTTPATSQTAAPEVETKEVVPADPPAPPAPVVEPAPVVPPVLEPQKGTKLTDEALQAELDKVRREAAGYRQRATAAEAGLSAVQQTLQQNPDDPTPTPSGPAPTGEVTTEELLKRLDAANLANALYRVAPQAGADAALLVPHLRGTGQLDKLDSNDPAGLDAALLTMAQAALVQYPQLKTAGAVAPPSAPGGPPAGQTLARTFTRAEVKAFTPEQFEDEALQAQVNDWLKAGAPE